MTLKKIPLALQGIVSQKISLYEAKLASSGTSYPQQTDFLNSLPKVWCCSPFVAEQCIRSPALIEGLVISGDLFSTQRSAYYTNALAQFSPNSQETLMRVLRQFRYREMVRIAWRDLAGWSTVDETLKDLSKLAEVCIQFALDYLYTNACKQQGVPRTSDGTVINIVVIGMGKLGGQELNYSSDVDLIFAYAEDGVLNDRKQTSYGEFFTRICQRLVKTLDEITIDGFVFRTDTRLRPFGDDGPLIMTFAGMENYYLTQAREWERYAMIKARQVGGDFNHGKQFFAIINPFVYRRYLDYSAFEALRSLKRQINQELKRKESLDNIKLGLGGIREIEFIAQVFQLIRGGKETDLQQRSVLKILTLLKDKQLLTPDDATQLQLSYYFLRKVENHIQQYQDKQTHTLPQDTVAQHIVAYGMGFSTWHDFKNKLDKIRHKVHSVFKQIFAVTETADTENNGVAVWRDGANEYTQNYLQQQGFTQVNDTLKLIQSFKQTIATQRLSNKATQVIERLMPALIDGMARVNNSDETLKRVLDLLMQVAGRNVYLSLLLENTSALSHLIKLSSASVWICEYLAKYPLLFDELLDTRSLYEPLNKQQLNQQLLADLNTIALSDYANKEEQLLIKLRQFKQLNVLRIAAADIMNAISIMVVSDYLSYVAEVVITHVVQIAWQILITKHGYPPNTNNKQMNFAVLGFGKLGGMELGYGSDLDMVFISDSKNDQALTNGNKTISCAQFYGRLAQKIRHILESKMLSGTLYEVDMRLRPNGDSGLLVTPIKSYQHYLQKNAWTWEHQALVKARFITGDATLKQQYQAIRQHILCLPRDTNTLKNELCKMRLKMQHAYQQKSAHMDLKYCVGGIVDIEFILQFLVLQYASKNKDLSRYTDNINLLNTLNQLAYISTDTANILKNAYCQYRDYGHQQTLQGKKMKIDEHTFTTTRKQIVAIWHTYLNLDDKYSNKVDK